MPNLAGAISSLLMSLPLIAVPCLAVFGLPSMGPATAEAEADDAIELGLSDSSAADALGHSSDQPPADGGFSPIVDAAPATPADTQFAAESRNDRRAIESTSDRRGASANHAIGIGEELASTLPPRPTGPATGTTTVAENPFADVQAEVVTQASASSGRESADTTAASLQGSWEQVIAQLKNKGVEDFFLANGEADGEFYFTCFFNTGNNTTQRFEAEGVTPLDAASTVLAEVEEWQRTR